MAVDSFQPAPEERKLPTSAARSVARLTAILAVAICLVGISLRTYFYLLNRSLWVDEAMLAVNIVSRTFVGLLQPLEYDQGAPVGFLLAQKVVASLFGNRDIVLRLIPFLAGCLSVPLVYVVAKRSSRGWSPLVALSLFSLSPTLIYYSSEVKQYSTDVLMALLLLLVAQETFRERSKRGTLLALGIAGALAMWISHPALFILAAILLTLALVLLVRRDVHRLSWLLGIAAAWGLTLALLYVVSLRNLTSNSSLLNFWAGSFAPQPIWSNLRWYWSALVGLVRDSAGLGWNPAVLVLLPLGLSYAAARRWQWMLLLVLPLLLALVASALGKYPFSGRMLLFLVPSTVLLLADGIELVRAGLAKLNRPSAYAVSAILAAYLVYYPALTDAKNLRTPPMRENIKPVLAYMAARRQSSDLVYVYYAAVPAVRFYAAAYGLDSAGFFRGVLAREEPEKYLADVDQLADNGRVWFVFAHNCTWCRVDEQNYILGHLDEVGQRLDEFVGNDAATYLYDLR